MTKQVISEVVIKKLTKALQRAKREGLKDLALTKELSFFIGSFLFAKRLLHENINTLYCYHQESDFNGKFLRSSRKCSNSTFISPIHLPGEIVYREDDIKSYDYTLNNSTKGSRFFFLFSACINNRYSVKVSGIDESGKFTVDLNKLRAMINLWEDDACFPENVKEAIKRGYSPFEIRQMLGFIQHDKAPLLGGKNMIYYVEGKVEETVSNYYQMDTAKLGL